MSKASFPKLEQFLGAYFHQDWALDDPDSTSVVQVYLKKASAKSLKALVGELEELKNEKLKEPSLKKCVQGLGCYFDPASEKKTYVQWISWLHKTLSQSYSK